VSTNRIICLALIAISVVGIAISAYLTTVHYADVELVCTTDGVVNCEEVLTSTYADVAGIPWSLGGIAWFGVTAALAAAALLQRPEAAFVQPAQVAWSLLGIATVVYLVGVEIFALEQICLWCTAMHALIVVVFVLHLIREPEMEEA
jgi:uncharacterized membrane protein